MSHYPSAAQYQPHYPWPYYQQPFTPPAQPFNLQPHSNDPWDHPPHSPWVNPHSPSPWVNGAPMWPAVVDPPPHQAHLWPWMKNPHPSPGWWGPHSFPVPQLRDTDMMPRPIDFPDDRHQVDRHLDMPPLVDNSHTPAWPMVPFNPQTPQTPAPFLPQPLVQPVVFTTAYYDRRSPPRRPADWRRDYVPPGRWKGLSMLRKAETNPPPVERCNLIHTLLMPNTTTPVMSLDLRTGLPLLDPSSSLEFLTSKNQHPPNETDLMQNASYFPVDCIRITHEYLPWTIDIRASTSPLNGVLIQDVLEQLVAALQTPIHWTDFYNRVLSAGDRERIAEAYRERAANRLDVMKGGVVKVDFLGTDCILHGFVEGRRGVWEMKTGPRTGR
ncbi:hypothetical protein MIND_00152600 [Mycena indigotica]|uniref:DUF6699 domain-containing protein n=1 Tax=Mycena indigotica TaxID=2126181 RepID=A0A8H6WIP3_9AGAR|nr:uncharacterized protein MIND_00152600 [Mycena indigotica]KAF7316338.1 hypothetical protein MIND_00152600 [Mycena indigotica]